MFAVSVNRFRHEAEAAVVGMMAIGLIAYVTGARMNDEYRSSGLADCLALRERSNCQPMIDRFGDQFSSMQLLIVPLVLLPALLGAFVGAPLVAREIESNSHRFLWTQGVSRQRWFASSSAVAVGLAAIVGVTYSVVAGAWLDTTNRVSDQRFGRLYDLQGVVPVASSVFAVAVGIACGIFLRRTVPAMGLTIGIFVAVRVMLGLFVRPRLASPITTELTYSGADPLAGTGAWELSNRTVDASGTVIGQSGSLDISGLSGRCPGINTAVGGPLPDPAVVERCLRDLDVRTVIRYHPGDRFWSFQLAESALLIGLAGVSLVAAHVRLRRNVA